ncbi:unnamed protein product, partial [Eruca vesicaria subsp. sativa]|nr:unnamed protein product [Eruca vesicaria subsp. sativa]
MGSLAYMRMFDNTVNRVGPGSKQKKHGLPAADTYQNNRPHFSK